MRVITWNIWGIPFGAPKMLSRPLRCGDKVGQSLPEPGELTIVCFQEAWGWAAGVFWPILKLAQCIEHLPTPLWFLSYVVYAIGALGVLLPVPPRWDPKQGIAQRVAAASNRRLGEDLFVVGANGISQDCCHAILDSGLFILVSKEPSESGFVRLRNNSGGDVFANKGFLWAYLEEEHLIIVNTHLQSPADDEEPTKVEQLREMKEFLNTFEETHKDCRIVIAGDLNMKVSRLVLAEEILSVKHLTEAAVPRCLDHVLANFELAGETKTEDVVALDHLSDHPLVQFCSREELPAASRDNRA